MVNEHTVDYHPSSSESTWSIHSLIFQWTPEGFISPEHFVKPVYPTMFAEKFQIYGIKVTGKYICESKNWICSFLLMYPSKTFPQVLLISPQAEGNYKFLLNSVLWKSISSQAEVEGRIMEQKKRSKLNLRGYCSQVLISYTIFATFTLLVFVLLCYNLDSSMLKCEGSKKYSVQE